MAAAAPGSKQRHAATAASPFCPHRRSLHGQGHLPRQPIPRPGMSQDVEGDKSRSIDGLNQTEEKDQHVTSPNELSFHRRASTALHPAPHGADCTPAGDWQYCRQRRLDQPCARTANSTCVGEPGWCSEPAQLQHPRRTAEHSADALPVRIEPAASGSTELAQGRNSPGVQGRFTPGAALGVLLAGTGLKAVRNAEGRYMLQLAESNVTTLPPMTVSTASLKQGTAEEGYRVSNVSGVGLWDQRSLRDTPYSISVVTSDLIENINAQNMGQIFKMNPLTQEPAIQNFTGVPQVTIRGFESINPVYDGIPMAYSSGSAMSVIEIDRVEILSGTSGFLYGGGRVGGAVNYVTKNSTDVPLRRLTFGNYGGTQFYGHADISGKFDERGRFGYRANLLYQGGRHPDGP